MKTILALIAMAGFWSAASAQLLTEFHTNLMTADIAVSDVVAIVMVNSIVEAEATNSSGRRVFTYTIEMKPERALKGTLPTEFRAIVESTNFNNAIGTFYLQRTDGVARRSVCFLKQDGKHYTGAIGGLSFRPLGPGREGQHFDWRSKYPSVEELESIVKKSLAQK